jgi:predicted metal-dependent phosphoesterase TrpH
MYIELHSRSAFSFLEGASLPEDLIATCANLNMPAMALLDRDGVYGAPRFHMAANRAGIKAHIGAEIRCTLLSNVILSETKPRSRGEVKSKDPYLQRNLAGVGIPRFARNDSSLGIFRNLLGVPNTKGLIR